MKKKNYLDYVPKKNPNFREYVNEDGLVVVVIPKHSFFDILAQKIRNTPKETNIKLDEYGSFIWNYIDGRNTIFDIAQKVKQNFGTDSEPLYERITKYFHILRDNKFITFMK